MQYGSSVPLYKVAQKCNRICWLCQRDVDMTIPWPHPMCGTRDHVKRLSEGGEDVLANIRLAHRICNEQREQGGIFAAIPVYTPRRPPKRRRWRPVSARRRIPYDRGSLDDEDLDSTG